MLGIVIALFLAFLLIAFLAVGWIREVIRSKQIELKHSQDIKDQRADAVKRSRSVIEGQVAEQLVPHFPEWKYTPSEARFLASPLDYVIFEGLSNDEIKNIKFVEVKTGQSKSGKRQISARKAIEEGRVGYELLELDMNGKPVNQEEIEMWIDAAKNGKTISEVASEFNRSTATICKYVPSGIFGCRGGLRDSDKVVLSPSDAAYLAGIIDGEGSISLLKIVRNNKTFISPVITITNTDKKLVDWVVSVYPNGVWRVRQRDATHKLVNEWALNKISDVAHLLSQLLPYLTIKKDKAKIVLEFCEYRKNKRPYSDKEAEFFDAFKKL